VVAATSAKASIIWSESSCAPDGDGAITGCTCTWSGNESQGYTMGITETLNSSPGHLVGHFTTDGTEDPTVDFVKTVTNNTSYSWSGYQFNMYMDQPFTVPGPQTDPGGWTPSVTTYPTGTYLDSHGNPFTNMATIMFTNVTGLNVDPSDSATFGSTINFSGYFLYTFELEQIAVPEPATLALIGLGGLPLLLRRRRS
jgi:hypothetical protein